MPETCKFHPDRTEVFYTYPAPNKLAHAFEGWLLCSECRGHMSDPDTKYFEEALNAQGRSSKRRTRSGSSKQAGDEGDDANGVGVRD